MKIALFGPSGSGKTTLAKFIAEEFGLIYIPGSSFSKLLTESQKKDLRALGYKETGHREVIALSHSNPKFGELFQTYVLDRRAQLISREKMFVTDRSPIDNVVYYLMQTVTHITDESFTARFIIEAMSAYQGLTHTIFVPVCKEQKMVETNGSRIDDLRFQRVVSAVFNHVQNEYFQDLGPATFTVPTWNLDIRKDAVRDFLNQNLL